MTQELVDLVDDEGRVRRRGVPRKGVDGAGPGLYLQIAIVVIDGPDGTLLVHRRGPRKSSSGLLDHVCGAVRSGESPREAALREVAEETGAQASSLRLRDTFVNDYQRMEYLFSGSVEGEPRIVDPDEVSEIFYARPEDLAGQDHVKGFWEDYWKTRQ